MNWSENLQQCLQHNYCKNFYVMVWFNVNVHYDIKTITYWKWFRTKYWMIIYTAYYLWNCILIQWIDNDLSTIFLKSMYYWKTSVKVCFCVSDDHHISTYLAKLWDISMEYRGRSRSWSNCSGLQSQELSTLLT